MVRKKIKGFGVVTAPLRNAGIDKSTAAKQINSTKTMLWSYKFC
jgi:hypothetical protein